jgi:uncharacterized protein (UPF0332 family)
MSVTPEDIFKLAQQLSLAEDEASKRAAISRAYYASFIASRSCVNERKLPVYTDNGSHEGVIEALRSERIADLITAAKELKRIKDYRKIADYDTDLSITDFQIQESLEAFENMTSIFDDYKSP